MKRTLLIFVITAITSTGYSQQAESPCNDSMYMELKKMPLEKMTDRQYNYFIQKDKECSNYQAVTLQEKTKNEQTEVTKNSINTYITIVVISGILALIIPLVLLR
jgi:hypothetical protein